MEQPLHTCMTKAVIADGDQLQSGPQWIMSRRAFLKLYEDHLQCGDWSINYHDIRDAILASFRTPILRLPGYVLSIRTDSKTFHFGVNGWQFWQGDLPFPVARTKSRLRISLISFLARAVLIGYTVYVVWCWLAAA